MNIPYYATIDSTGRVCSVDSTEAASLTTLTCLANNGEIGCIRAVVGEDIFRRYADGEEITYTFTRGRFGSVRNLALVA